MKLLILSSISLLPISLAAAPVAPSAVVVKVQGPTQIELIWVDTNPRKTGSLIERRRSGKENFVKTGQTGPNVTKFTDQDVTQNSKYYYRISALSAEGNSPFSEVVEARTPEAPPAAPTGLLATVVSSEKVNVMWTDNSNNEMAFILERKTGVKGTYAMIETLSTDQTFLRDQVPGPGIYVYRIKAKNDGGETAYSNEYGVVIKPGEKKRISPYILTSGYNNILNLQITGTSENWLLTDVAHQKLDEGYEWWYFLGGKIVKTKTNLKNEPWKGNQPGRLIKMAGKVGLSTFNKWDLDPAKDSYYYDHKAGQTLEDNSIGGVTTFMFK